MAAQYYINSPGCRRQLLIADFILKTEAEMGKTDNDITPFLGPQKVGYFLRRNFRIGVLSAVIADAILWGAAYWLVSYEPELIRVITPEVMLLVSVSVLVFGVLITWLCALLSINKYLKMKASTLYYI